MESLRITADDGTGLHVAVTGDGPDVVVLSGGPGCVHYLEHDHLAPRGVRAWFPEPRGVGRSEGGRHDLARAVADLEAIREVAGAPSWTVLGHSWGSDLGVRYALDHPDRVDAVVGVAGHGLHKDRTWSRAYEALRHTEDAFDIPFDAGVHDSLGDSFIAWIHEPELFRRLADCQVPMTFLAAADDIRPSWPLQQLARLVPGGSFEEIPDVPHNLWSTHPDVWVETVTRVCGRDL